MRRMKLSYKLIEPRADKKYLYQPRMDTGSNENSQRYWLIVYFENEKVVRIDKDVETNPN